VPSLPACLVAEPPSLGSVRRTGQSPTPAVSFFPTGLYPARSYFKQKKQRREILVKAARRVAFELSSESSFYSTFVIESRLKPHPFMYVNFPNLVIWTDLFPFKRGSILIDRDRQELSNKNRIPKAYSLPFLSTLSMKAMKEFVHRMLFDCTNFFFKTTVRDTPGGGDCTKGDPFYRSFGWVCP
jgi:hypothetical protein